ncbi:hypothetical protein Aple_003060 [Acrocarpospora pleiomorpha]|uniref:Uncharacterized protein n=1 Tax=Acrocarpospora pleiomorpha TaxID=90975 RepID=A0A5M3XD09_9ACTN|nr:hypothetical protein Aple_003060 [Acrocarpospora pleiomorpha]
MLVWNSGLVGAADFGGEGSSPFTPETVVSEEGAGLVRRVILGHAPDGRACILADERTTVQERL